MTDRYKRALAILESLAARWPNTFFMFEGRRRPLKIGIRDEIQAALGDTVTPRDLGFALQVYCTNPRYRSRLVAGATRIDLGGGPAGIVTETEVPPKAPARKKSPSKAPPPAASPRAAASPPLPPAAPKRISLANLREAAQRRKAAVPS